jgi:glycosyltransferase involved in cell wall biosynthesis
MRILLLNDRIPPEGKGGAESVVWRLAKGLAAADHDVHIITTTDGDAFDEVRDGIPTYHLRAGYPQRFRAWLSLWNPQTVGAFGRLLRRIQPDVVNAHNIHTFLSYHCMKLARDAGCGVVFSAHDANTITYGKLRLKEPPAKVDVPGAYRLPARHNLRENRLRYNPFRNTLIKRYLARHTHIRTAPSQALAQAYALNHLPSVEVVYNGIDATEWRRAEASLVNQLRRRLDLEDTTVILIAGRLTREKGMRQMLLALDRLRAQYPRARLLVLTSRDIESQIQPAYAHLRPLIRVGGWLSGAELRAAFQLADIVAVPSICLDPFPTVVLEAMASQTPVVATVFGGAAEAVDDGEMGYIVNPFDTAVFADRLERLLRDPGLRREMGKRSQARVAAHFSLDQQVANMIDTYERALAMR